MKSKVIEQLGSWLSTTASPHAPAQFKVPPYQRDYCWSKVQWQQLWEDLEEAANTGDPHFLGIVVTVPLSKQNVVRDEDELSNIVVYSQYLLVDGQQRITTLLLLARAFELELIQQRLFCSAADAHTEEEISRRDAQVGLRDSLLASLRSFLYNLKRGVSGESRLRVALSDSEQKGFNLAFADVIHEKTGLKPPKRTARVNATSFEKALAFFRAQIQDQAGKAGTCSESERDYQDNYMTAYVSALLTKLILVVVELDRDETGDVAFERINATGKPLAATDLLKNMLFSIEKQEVAKQHPGVTDNDRAYFPFSSLLSDKRSDQLVVSFKLYFQLHYGVLSPSKNRYCPLFEKAMKEDKVRLLSDMRIILEEVGKESSAPFTKDFFSMSLCARVAERLIDSRSLEVNAEVATLLQQLTVLIKAKPLKADSSLKSYLQAYLKLISGVLSNTEVASAQLRAGRAYCVDAFGRLRIPPSFGHLSAPTAALEAEQALEFMAVVYELSPTERLRYKALPLVVDVLEEASNLSPGITWKELYAEQDADTFLKNVVNYLLVPVDSLVDELSPIEEKFAASNLVKVPHYFSTHCTIDTLEEHFKQKFAYLAAHFSVQHTEAFEYLDIAQE